MNIAFWHRKDQPSRTICVCHDIERGLGHVVEDPSFAAAADHRARADLEEMLTIEEEMDIRATYNVVGSFLQEVRAQIQTRGHCLAFHSFDHRPESEQLAKCRLVDANIKGYRPPQSVLTAELDASNLMSHQFEWLASSAYSLGIQLPEWQNGILKIPIAFDDFALYRHGETYKIWEKRALHRIQKSSFIAFSLHDCYAPFWLPYYRHFLGKISKMGNFKTLEEVADQWKR